MQGSKKRPSPRSRARPGRSRAYHHGTLAEALVATAVEMIEEGGVSALSLREAARRAGVSSGAPFRHFESREALLVAVAERVARRLDRAMKRVAARHEDPLDRFRAMGVAYVVWAVKHPALFSLLHSAELHREGLSHGIALVERAQRDMIARLISKGPARVGSTDAEVVLLAGHSLVYGLARLLTDRLFTPGAVSPARARQLALEVTAVLGRGLGAGSAEEVAAAPGGPPPRD